MITDTRTYLEVHWLRLRVPMLGARVWSPSSTKIPHAVEEHSPCASTVREATTSRCKRRGFHSWVGKIPWGRGRATHSSVLAWRIPWTEEPGGLQSTGSPGVTSSDTTEGTYHARIDGRDVMNPQALTTAGPLSEMVSIFWYISGS